MARPVETDFAAYRDRGDARALARVFDVLAPQLLLVAAHLLRDRAQAEDVVQETFLRAMAAAKSYEASRPLLPWLVGILQNEAKKARRDRARRPDPEQLEHLTSDPTQEVEGREFLDELSSAVASLPEAYRDVLNLRLIHGLEPREIAHSLGRSPSTVSTQLQRGLQLLRRVLPVGFAGVLACSVNAAISGAGLAAARSVVLKKGRQLWPVGAGVVSGGLLMKKLLVALCLLLVLVPVGYEAMGAWLPVELSDDAVLGATELPVLVAKTVDELEGTHRERMESARAQVDEWLVTGRVLNHEGMPVSGARVEARMHRGPVVTEVDQAVSDQNGVYQIDFGSLRELGILERATGSLHLKAFAPGYVSTEDGKTNELPWLPGDPIRITLDLALTPGAWLRGRVLSEDLSPVAGASIRAWMGASTRQNGSEQAEGVRSFVETDSEGRYELAVVKDGFAGLRVSSDTDGLAVQDLGPISITKDVDVPDIELTPFKGISGRLVLTDGSPLAMIPISIRSRDSKPAQFKELALKSLWFGGSTTDVDGRFRVAGLEDGEYSLSLGDFLWNKQKFVVNTWDPPGEYVFEGQLLSVRLRDEEDRPLPGQGVAWRGWSASDAPSAAELQIAERGGAALAGAKFRGVSHAYALPANYNFLIPEGSAWVFSGHLAGTKPMAEYWRVVNGVYRAELTLIHEIAVEVGQLEFDIRDELGNPVTNYYATIKDPLGALVGLYEDGDDGPPEMPGGTYRIQLQSGRRELRLVWQNFPMTGLLEVVAGKANKVTLRVRRGGFIRLMLKPPVGDTVEAWKGIKIKTNHPKQEKQPRSLYVVLSEGRTVLAMSNPPVGKPGLCTVNFEPGRHELTISAEGYAEVHVPVLVTAGEVTEVEVFMERK